MSLFIGFFTEVIGFGVSENSEKRERVERNKGVKEYCE